MAGSAKTSADTCEVVVCNVPGVITDTELLDFFNGAIVAATGLQVEPFAEAAPCTGCIINRANRTAKLIFRTQAGAAAAFCLDGIDCRGTMLRIAGPKGMDKQFAPEMPDLSVQDLLGMPEPLDLPRRKKVKVRTWYERHFRPRGLKSAAPVVRGQTISTPDRSHYEVLQVHPTASPCAIRRAFHQKCRGTMVGQPSGGAMVAEFSRITEANRVLACSARRAAYDYSRLAHEACGGRLQFDMRTAAFMLRHTVHRALSTTIRRAIVNRCFLEPLAAAIPRLRDRCGIEMLAFTDPTQQVAAEVLLECRPEQVGQAHACIMDHIKEVRGLRAPLDGCLLLVPPATLARLQRQPGEALLQAQVVSRIWDLTKTEMRFFEDRISLRGQFAFIAVSMCQPCLEWQGQVLLPDNCVLDSWSFAYLTERTGGYASPAVVPTIHPDLAAVRRVFQLALRHNKAVVGRQGVPETLVPLGLRVFEELWSGAQRLTHTVLKLAVSAAAYHEVMAKTTEQQAAFISGLLRLWTTFQIRLPLEQFSRHPLTCVIAELRQLLLDPQQGVGMRVVGLRETHAAVSELGRWHPWTELLTPGSKLLAYLEEVLTWLSRHRPHLSPIPPEWAGLPPIAAVILVICCGDAAKVDLDKGISRNACPAAVIFPPAPTQPAATPSMPVPPPAPPGPPTGPPPRQQQTPLEKPSRRHHSRQTSHTRSPSCKRHRSNLDRVRARDRDRDRDRDRERDRDRDRGSRTFSDRNRDHNRDRDRGDRNCRDRRACDSNAQRKHVILNTKNHEALTPVECMEDVLSRLPADSEGLVPLSLLVQEAQRLVDNLNGSGQLSRKWFEAHPKSFVLHPRKGTSATSSRHTDMDWCVQLTLQAQRKVAQRKQDCDESMYKDQRQDMLAEARAWLATGPRVALQVSELRPAQAAAALCMLARSAESPPGPPARLARRLLCQACAAGALPKELHRELRPFPPALVMQAIVALEDSRHEEWDETCLLQIMQGAALDLHEYAEWPRASLTTVALSLRHAARTPFRACLRSEQCLLLPAAVLRLEVEVSEEAALDPSEGLFRPFSEACVGLANISMASTPEAHRSQVVKGFAKLAQASEHVGRQAALGSYNPESLCPFAMAVALLGQACSTRGCSQPSDPQDEVLRKAGIAALDNLSRCLASAAATPADGPTWSPQQLAMFATAYSLMEMPCADAFKRITAVAERQVRSGLEWPSEHLWKFLAAAESVGLLASAQELLQSLHTRGLLLKHVMAASPTDMPVIFSVTVLLDDPFIVRSFASFSDCCSYENLEKLPLRRLLQVLSAWPHASGRWASLTAVKITVLEAAMVAARAAQLGELSSLQVQSLLRSVADSGGDAAPRILRDLGDAPTVVQALAPKAGTSTENVCRHVATTMRPFAERGVRAPLLESLCMVWLLHGMEGMRTAHLEQVGLAIRDLVSVGALAAMPAAVAALAGLPALLRVVTEVTQAVEVSEETGGEDALEDLLSLLLRRPKTSEGEDQTSEAGEQLGQWVRHLEELTAEAATVGADGTEVRHEGRGYWTPTGLAALVGRNTEVREAKQTLGPAWLEILLTKSVRLSWDGVSRIDVRPPQPRAALQHLAVTAAGLRDPAVFPEGQVFSWPPLLLVRGARDEGVIHTMAGTYVACGEHHGKTVYKRSAPLSKGGTERLLYYWDDRDGEGHRGWWFGPKVGSNLCWAHHKGSPEEERPPRHHWKLMLPGMEQARISVLCLDRPRMLPPGPPPKQARSRCLTVDVDSKPATPACSPMVRATVTTASLATEPPAAKDSAQGSSGHHTSTEEPRPSVKSLVPQAWTPMIKAAAVAAGSSPAKPTNEGCTLKSTGRVSAAEAPTPHEASGRCPPDGLPPVADNTEEDSAAVVEQLRHAREEGKAEREQRLWDWLSGLDKGAGSMLQYFNVLCAEFDADLAQIAAARSEDYRGPAGLLDAIDPFFWEIVKVQKSCHRMLFALGISCL